MIPLTIDRSYTTQSNTITEVNDLPEIWSIDKSKLITDSLPNTFETIDMLKDTTYSVFVIFNRYIIVEKKRTTIRGNLKQSCGLNLPTVAVTIIKCIRCFFPSNTLSCSYSKKIQPKLP